MKKIIVLLLSIFIVIAAFRNKEITITGTVKNENGNPVAATVKAGSITTTSDLKGNYKITVSDKDEYLVFSAAGYITQKIKIRNKNVVNVILKKGSLSVSDSGVLEMKAIGYGTKSKQLMGVANSFYASKSPVGSVTVQ